MSIKFWKKIVIITFFKTTQPHLENIDLHKQETTYNFQNLIL